jgi:hypothetical protein
VLTLVSDDKDTPVTQSGPLLPTSFDLPHLIGAPVTSNDTLDRLLSALLSSLQTIATDLFVSVSSPTDTKQVVFLSRSLNNYAEHLYISKSFQS